MIRTIGELGNAWRGWSRETEIFVRLPDGTLGRIAFAETGFITDAGGEHPSGRQSAVLVVVE